MSKVLLVEDDNNLREIYEARLAAEGYDIITAQNGEEALVVAKQNKPDLIISDVMMPRISGFEMLDILRNTDELRETKVIMLTALGQAEDQVRAGKLGADKYLVKSQVTLEDIVNTAKELLGEVPATVAPTPEATAAVAPEVPAAGPVATEPLATPAPAAPQPAPEQTPAPAPPTDTTNTPAVTEQVVAPAPVTPEPTAPAAAAPVPVADPDPLGPIAQPTTAPSNDVVIVPTTPADQPGITAQTDTAQTTAAEEATVTSQIENFASTAVEQQGEAPAAAAEVVAPVSVSTANDRVLAVAVDDLAQAAAAPTEGAVPPSQKQIPGAEVPVAAPAPAMAPAAEVTAVNPAPTPNNELQAIAGKKIIQPLSSPASPGQNLDELLAREEAKEQLGGNPQPVVVSTPVAASPAAGLGTDPNSIAL